VATLEAIERTLRHGAFVDRYQTEQHIDGLPPGEGSFLACSFWLVSALALAGRVDDARELFESLLLLRNDVGLLAEEYDVDLGRMTGNFPQAFSHLALVEAAATLESVVGSAGVLRGTTQGDDD
jgi:GH15 family glucan-1,4-alpha-glucosidase